MKTKITEISVCNFKGHVIRKVETEFGCEVVLIDNTSNEIENAPILMEPQDYTYSSVADAKRFINGEAMKWIPQEAEILGDKYWNRFKQS